MIIPIIGNMLFFSFFPSKKRYPFLGNKKRDQKHGPRENVTEGIRRVERVVIRKKGFLPWRKGRRKMDRCRCIHFEREKLLTRGLQTLHVQPEVADVTVTPANLRKPDPGE